MYEDNKTKNMVIGGLLLAIGLILPSVFHFTNISGKIFLPMHIPVLIGGFLLPPSLAIILGFITPLLSSLLTGMPPIFPMAVIMAFELAFYGFSASVFYKKMKLPTIVSLILSMIVGRIIAGLTVFVLGSLFAIDFAPPLAFIIGGVTTGIPGIIIQIVLIPSVIYLIERYTTINFD